jgi:hypothetical protein
MNTCLRRWYRTWHPLDAMVRRYRTSDSAAQVIGPEIQVRSGRDDKGEGRLPRTVVAEREPFFITLGGPKTWPKTHDSSVEKHFHERSADRSSLHYAPPDFLSRLLALIIFMRFPLRETAPAVLASAAK